jgi:large subunit ribosomal protein L2
MSVRKFKPTTPGQRHKVALDMSGITAAKPEKSLVKGGTKSGGRNNDGRMTMRYIGGGHKQKYRMVDFKRNRFDIPATVKSIEYDPNRTANIALIYYADGVKSYILAPNGLKVGDTVVSGKTATPNVGNAMFLSDVPLGTMIHNIELMPGKGGSVARGAGVYGQLAAREGKFAVIKMPSGETRMILVTCLATVGVVSNGEHNLERSGKAGRSRWLGRRPRVRGVVMNPVDHPMGGGEGRNAGGHPRSRNGMPAKGYKTRSKTKYSNKFIIERRKK